MKRINSILAISLFMLAGCGGGKQSDDLITIDVTKSYPKKELILQDFMDVEYIPLETGGDFYCQGVILDIGKDVILVKNQNSDGDIFVFDRNGKGLRKINRMGRGGEEYMFILGVTLDEGNDEMFVNDPATRTIWVYDLFGKFKRSIKDTYSDIFNFGRENLICVSRNMFSTISKQDGSLVKNIEIPFEKAKSPVVMRQSGEISVGLIYRYPSIIPYHDSWILTESSSDTIFRLLPDYSMSPFMVRTPSIQTMEEPEVFLFPSIFTERYYFVESVKKESEFPKTRLMYDRQEKKIFEYVVYNDDYTYKHPVNFERSASTDEIAFCQKIEADDLFDAYKEGQLKGKLKEIATNLKEEDNPVLMVVKYKK